MTTTELTQGLVPDATTEAADAATSVRAPSRPPALSPSRANDFMQCPLLFRFRTVDRLPEPQRHALQAPALLDVRARLSESAQGLHHVDGLQGGRRQVEARRGQVKPRLT